MITTTDISERRLRFIDLQGGVVSGVTDRFMTRRQGLWNAFEGMRTSPHHEWSAQLFTLHAAGYRYALARIEVMAWLELQATLYIFDRALMSIDAEAQRWVIEEAAKRYAHSVDMALLDAKVATKSLSLSEKTQNVDAKIAALEADAYALETERTRLNITLERNVLRVQELETQVQLMDAEIAYAEADVLKEQLKRIAAEIDVVKTEIRGVELQQAITRVALSIAQEEVRRAEIQTEIERTNVQIEKEQLTEVEAQIEAERLANMQEETAARASSRSQETAHRSSHYAVVAAYLAGLRNLYVLQAAATEDEARSKADLALTSADGQLRRTLAESRFSSIEQQVRVAVGQLELETQIERERADDGVSEARIAAAEVLKAAAIDAASTLATANISSTLTHQIMKG